MQPSPPVDADNAAASSASASEDASKGAKPIRRRGYKACERCRSQKAKCDFGDPDAPDMGEPCKRCKREGRVCTFPPDTGKPFARKAPTTLPRKAAPDPPASSSSAAVVTPVASTSAAPTSRSLFDSNSPGELGSNKRRRTETGDEDDDEGFESGTSSQPEGNALFSSTLHNPNDALRLLSLASSTLNPTSSSGPSQQNPLAHLHAHIPALHAQPHPHRATSSGWNGWPPVANGILSQAEGEYLFDLFRVQMSPLYPILPDEIFSTSYLPILCTTEYLLLAAIITIASRYGTTVNPTANARQRIIHHQMSAFCRENISYITDGSQALRHISSVETLLLLVEWPSVPVSHPFLEERRGEADDFIKPSIAYDSLSWSYIGCAIRLAQELGIDDPTKYSSDLESPGNTATSWVQERSLRTWIYAYNADRHVSVRLGRSAVIQTHMSSEWWESVCKIASNKFYARGLRDEWAEPMPQGFLASLLGTIQDRLYPNREMTRAALKSGYWEGFLRSLGHEIDHMQRSSASILKQGGVAATLLQIELDYVGLYAGTISLRALQIRSQRRLKALDIFSLSATLLNLQEGPFILAAIQAAQSILRNTVENLQPYLRVAPARLFQRILFSATFLFKALAVGVIEDGQSSILRLLEQTIEALEHASRHDDQLISSGFAHLLRRLHRQFDTPQGPAPNPFNTTQPQTSAPATATIPVPFQGQTGVEEYNPLQPFQWGPTTELQALGREQDLLFHSLWSTDAGFGTQSFNLVETLCGDEWTQPF